MDIDYAHLLANLGIRGSIQGYEFHGHCPFHNDKSPSFSFNIQKGVGLCFRGCFHGEFTELVERVLECSPQEARDWIDSNGRKLGVEALSRKLSESLAQGSAADHISNNFWRQRYLALHNNVMPMWFLQRGFTWKTINHWRLAYDPLWDSVTIPIFWQGELVGTVTRNTKENLPKYENSPQLPKSEILFGEINDTLDTIILCEGMLDVLWFWQNGYNVAGLFGSSISRKQIEILRKYRYGEIVLAFDNDDAGRQGTFETIGLLIRNGFLLPQIRVLMFPGANKEDPEYRKDANDCTPEQLADLYKERKEVLNDPGIFYTRTR